MGFWWSGLGVFFFFSSSGGGRLQGLVAMDVGSVQSYGNNVVVVECVM